MKRALLLLALVTACASPGPRGDPFRGTSGDRCTTVQVDNHRWERAVIYRGHRRVGSVEGKMAGSLELCQPGDLDIRVHFIGNGNLRPRQDPSVGRVGAEVQELIMVLGLTDLQSFIRQR